MKKKNLYTTLCAVFSVLIAGAQSNPTGQQTETDNPDLKLNTITTAAPFMVITPDSRSGAMGDVGAAISPDANTIFWNGSKMVFSEKDFETSISYSPWLKNLVDGINLSYLSGFAKVGDRHAIGGSLRYFTLGEITFTDENGTEIRPFKPNEFALTAAYAFLMSERWSIGLNGKFIYSNLTGGITVGGGNTKAGLAGAADISLTYFNKDLKVGKKDGEVSFAFVLANIGNKMSYSDNADRDFLPTNMRIGTAFKLNLDNYNSLTFGLDLNKLLVPTPPVYAEDEDGELIVNSEGDGYVIASGKDPEVGVATGMFQSFYDAPGIVARNEAGQMIQNDDGSYQIVKNSRLKEEINEINIGIGIEYWYKDLFSVRTGFFREHPTKGNRQFWTVGAGLQYKVFGLDISYLTAFNQQHPLANTVRFTLQFKFNKGQLKKNDDAGGAE